MSADKPTVIEALAGVMEAVRAVKKGDRNAQQGYQFRGIDSVINAVGPELRRHHVVVMPEVQDVTYRDVQTSTGKPSRECTVKVRYRFYGPQGDYVDCTTPGESLDFGDKGAPKAMSVAYRIALLQALCLPTDDPEPDAASYERAPALPTADDARFELRLLCEESKWNTATVAARFQSQHGMDIRACDDVELIRQFRKSLFSVSDSVLRSPPNAPESAPEPALPKDPQPFKAQDNFRGPDDERLPV